MTALEKSLNIELYIDSDKNLIKSNEDSPPGYEVPLVVFEYSKPGNLQKMIIPVLPKLIRIYQKLKAFVPSWPSVIMGTGALTIALSLSSKIIPAISYLASAFLIITTAMAVFILTTWILRLIHHPTQLWADLKHPVTGSFVPTMPISLMILALVYIYTGWTRLIWSGSCI